MVRPPEDADGERSLLAPGCVHPLDDGVGVGVTVGVGDGLVVGVGVPLEEEVIGST
jgi:hypothetical protein